MQRSKYYVENGYLNSIVLKQDKNRPITVQQLDTPYHFRQKQMNSYEKNKVVQLKILQNPDLYMHTHIKCNVCNTYVPIDEVDHHSYVHLEEEEKVDNILSKQRL